MTFHNIDKLDSIKNNDIISIHKLNFKFSSARKKYYLIDQKGKKYFAKYVGDEIAKSVSIFYDELSQDPVITKSMPGLIASEKGWLFYEWVSGTLLLKNAIIFSLLHLPGKTQDLFQSLGRWLANFHNFTIKEECIIADYLSRDVNLNDYKLPIENNTKMIVCKTYNDFTMRNIFVQPDNSFFCFDIDSAFNPLDPLFMFPYNDISYFIIHVLSLSKIPIVSFQRLKPLINSFLKGYFSNSNAQYSPDLLKFFIRLQFNGILIDRPIPAIFPGFKNYLFIKRLSSFLLDDSYKLFGQVR